MMKLFRTIIVLLVLLSIVPVVFGEEDHLNPSRIYEVRGRVNNQENQVMYKYQYLDGAWHYANYMRGEQNPQYVPVTTSITHLETYILRQVPNYGTMSLVITPVVTTPPDETVVPNPEPNNPAYPQQVQVHTEAVIETTGFYYGQTPEDSRTIYYRSVANNNNYLVTRNEDGTYSAKNTETGETGRVIIDRNAGTAQFEANGQTDFLGQEDAINMIIMDNQLTLVSRLVDSVRSRDLSLLRDVSEGLVVPAPPIKISQSITYENEEGGKLWLVESNDVTQGTQNYRIFTPDGFDLSTIEEYPPIVNLRDRTQLNQLISELPEGSLITTTPFVETSTAQNKNYFVDGTGDGNKIVYSTYAIGSENSVARYDFDSINRVRQVVLEENNDGIPTTVWRPGGDNGVYYTRTVKKDDKGQPVVRNGETQYEYVRVEGEAEIQRLQNEFGEVVDSERVDEIEREAKAQRVDIASEYYKTRPLAENLFGVIDAASASAQKFSGISSLFMSKEQRNAWIEERDQFFSDNYLGTQYWASGICRGKLNTPNKNVAFYENPSSGRTRVTASVNGEQITSLNTSEGVQFLYKFQFYVVNPRDSYTDTTHDEGDEVPELCFRVKLQPGDVEVFDDQFCLDGGEVSSRSGNSAIVLYSTNDYDRICLELIGAPRLYGGSNPLCNVIVNNPTVPTILPTSSVVGGDGGNGGSQTNQPRLNDI